DVLRANPRYRSAPPMHLYAMDRVEMVEQKDAFQQAKTKSESRSHSGKLMAARKVEELTAQVESMPVMVERMPMDTLRQRAMRSYNMHHAELAFSYWKREYEPASEKSDPAFLERITVNFIRHHLTEYDGHLEEVAGKIGVNQARVK